MAEPILTVDHLVKSYDGKTNVLDDVSFAVKPGRSSLWWGLPAAAKAPCCAV